MIFGFKLYLENTPSPIVSDSIVSKLMSVDMREVFKYVLVNVEEQNRKVIHRIFLMLQKLYKKQRISLTEASDIISLSILRKPVGVDSFLFSSKVNDSVQCVLEDFKHYFPQSYQCLSHPFSSIKKKKKKKNYLNFFFLIYFVFFFFL